jgi:hypothetical protein
MEDSFVISHTNDVEWFSDIGESFIDIDNYARFIDISINYLPLSINLRRIIDIDKCAIKY